MARRSDMPLGPTRSQLSELVRYYSTRAIARRYGVGQTTVRRWVQVFQIRIPRGKMFPIHDL